MRNLLDTPLMQSIGRDLEASAAAAAAAEEAQKRSAAIAARRGARMYAAARRSRLANGWGLSNSSEDAELAVSLAQVRSRSRQLVRDAPYARRLKTVLTNYVIGAEGIGLQPLIGNTRNALNARLNEQLEELWEEHWCNASYIHTGGALAGPDMERQAFGQVFEAGEVFIRLVPQAFGGSPVPLALELIEAERVADQYTAVAPSDRRSVIKLGIELDEWGRAQKYYFHSLHPGESQFMYRTADQVFAVPAEFILHLRIVERWPQTRAIPWMHAVAAKLADLDGYTEAEIVGSRAAANIMAFIEAGDDFGTPNDATGERELNLEAGTVELLQPGEKVHQFNPNRPNAQAEAFIRAMLREIAAGANVSYESLSRDHSQSNYSSSRLALLDDREYYKAVQRWWIRAFRKPLHRMWLQQAVFSGALGIGVGDFVLNQKKYERAKFTTRGFGWIDPQKETQSSIDQITAGMTTLTHVIAENGDGRDLADVAAERKRELELLEEMDLEYTTSPSQYTAKAAAAAAPAPAAAETPDPAAAEDDPSAEDGADDSTDAARVIPLRR